jgi:CSLREA domain-containing protein
VIAFNAGGINVSTGGTNVQGNTIRDNTADGVIISSGTGNLVSRNSIFNNGTMATHLGIDLVPANGVNANDLGDADTGPNNLQNFPVLTSATTDGTTTTVTGTLDSAAGTYTIEFFSNATCDASGNGEGELFLGSTGVTIPAGAFSFGTPTAPSAGLGRRITATASRTVAPLDTSEFSACATVVDGPQPGPILTVNTNADADDGVCGALHCTLREAINRANTLAGANTINFNIAGAGPHVINVTGSDLPNITQPVTIDGLSEPDVLGGTCPLPTGALAVQIDGGDVRSNGLRLEVGSDGSTIRGLSITNFGGVGILVRASNNSVTCNYLGVATDGVVVGTNGNGLGVFSDTGTNNTIGGPSSTDGNVIAANNNTGLLFLASGNRVQRNTIRGNTTDGVTVSSGTGNLITQNSIFNNGTSATDVGIELGGNGVTPNDPGDVDGDANNQQNFPVLARASTNGGNTTVVGTLDSVAGSYTIELFSNPACDASGNGEGEVFRGSTTVTIDPVTNPTGAFTATLPTAVTIGQAVTATASRNVAPLDTSEFSACRTVTPPPGVTIAESGGTAVTEGGPDDTFTVVLNAPPTSDVTIAFNTGTQLQPITSIVFTTANWNVAQPVTVAAVDDTAAEGAHSGTVQLTASSADAGYNGIAIPSVNVSITDNDAPGFTVSPTSGLSTTEAGGTATFTVRLNTVPAADVTIALTSSDTTEGTVSPAALTFTPANALTAQTVTVTGVQDTVADGNVAYLIVTGAAMSGDLSYSGLDPADVSMTNTDDDVAGTLGFSAATAQVAENGGSVTLTVQRGGVGPAGAAPAGAAPAAGGVQSGNVPSGSVRPSVAPSPGPNSGPIHPNAVSAVTVSYTTANGTATAGQDYTATSGTLNFGVGETTKTITVPILADAIDELPETFTVTLSNPSSGATLGATSTATVTITDVDTTPCNTFLSEAVPAGTTVLPVISQAGCAVGDIVAVDQGTPNEERGTIVGFGSIILETPTIRAHAAGALVVRVGVVPAVVPPLVSPGDDDTDKPRKETEEERRQREHTNRGGQDDVYVEGNVVETRCDLAWPTVIIANRDGNVEVRLVKEAVSACRSIQVGDYLEADGEKQHEFLFDADTVEIRRNGERVR